MTFYDVRFVIAAALILLFAGAYAYHPTETMNGALIGAFNIAVGYYLGSSSGASKASENTSKALDLAQSNAPTPPVPDIKLKPGETAQAVEE